MHEIELGSDGRSATLTDTVTAQDTAAAFGPDFPAAASTPFVLGLAEVACHNAVASRLKTGEITVGVRALIDHLLPSRVGTELLVRAGLVRRTRNRLYFHVEVSDGVEVVARVKHVRAVVDGARLQARIDAK